MKHHLMQPAGEEPEGQGARMASLAAPQKAAQPQQVERQMRGHGVAGHGGHQQLGGCRQQKRGD